MRAPRLTEAPPCTYLPFYPSATQGGLIYALTNMKQSRDPPCFSKASAAAAAT